MNSRFVKIITASLVIVVLTIGAVLALAEDKPATEVKKPTYVGNKGCKTCHMGEAKGKMWEIWLESKHSKSMSVLKPEEAKDPKCLKCHTTGFGEAGGYAVDIAAEKAVPEAVGSVGCEACHGAGSEYKGMAVMKDKNAAIAAGLVIPDEKTCTKCHNSESPTFKSFDYKTALAKIAHKIPPKAEKPAEAPAAGGK
jgi:hypothetical protein